MGYVHILGRGKVVRVTYFTKNKENMRIFWIHLLIWSPLTKTIHHNYMHIRTVHKHNTRHENKLEYENLSAHLIKQKILTDNNGYNKKDMILLEILNYILGLICSVPH